MTKPPPLPNVDQSLIENSNTIKTFRKMLNCETLEECKRIQQGSLWLRRIAKYSVLFNLAVAFAVNKMIDLGVDDLIQKYNETKNLYDGFTKADAWKWTGGLFVNTPAAPELNEQLISLYHHVNHLQLIMLFAFSAYSLRWIYADFRVENNTRITFKVFCFISVCSNITLYIGLLFFIP